MDGKPSLTRRRLLFLAIPLLLLLGVACSGLGRWDNRVLVRFTYLWTGAEGEAMEKIISAFNASQDEIVVKGVSNPSLKSQLAAMANATSSFDISDGSNVVGSWADQDLLEPLDDYISRDAYDTTDFTPVAMAQSRYKDKTYALPLAVYTMQLLYNKALFRQAGISTPPATTSEWAAAIAKLTKIENGQLVQLGFANLDLKTMAFQFGGKWFDEHQNPTPDHPGNVEAAQFYVDNVTAKYGATNVQKFTSALGEYSPQNPFYRGTVAMIYDGSWQSALINQFAPDLEWGVASLPYPDDRPELKGATQLSSSIIFIPRNALQKAEAWTFMKYLLDKKSMLSFTHATANLPARTSLLGDSTYDDLPHFNTWLESLKASTLESFNTTPISQQYITDIAAAVKIIALGQKTPQEALSELASKAATYR